MGNFEKYTNFEDFSNYDTSTGEPNAQHPDIIEKEEAVKQREEQKFEEGKKIGYEEGFKAKEFEIKQRLDVIESELLVKFTEMHTIIEEIREKTKRNAGNLAITIINNLVPAMIKSHPFTEVEKLVNDCMIHIEGDYNIVISVPSDIRDDLDERLQKMSKENGFKGVVFTKADKNLHGTDCVIEWPEGGIVRDMRRVEEEINVFLKRHDFSNNLNLNENVDDGDLSEDESQ